MIVGNLISLSLHSCFVLLNLLSPPAHRSKLHIQHCLLHPSAWILQVIIGSWDLVGQILVRIIGNMVFAVSVVKLRGLETTNPASPHL